MQALMPNQAGTAATLFANTANLGFLCASLTSGGWAQAFGYRSMFLASAFLSALGFVAIQLQPEITAALRSPNPGSNRVPCGEAEI